VTDLLIIVIDRTGLQFYS